MLSRSALVLCRNSRLIQVQRNSLCRLGASRGIPAGPKQMGYVRPLVFATAFGVFSYTSCAIWDFEKGLAKARKRSHMKQADFDQSLLGSPWFYIDENRNRRHQPKRGEFREMANSWWNSLSSGHKTVAVIIGLNAGVLMFLRLALPNRILAPIAQRYFLLSPTSSLMSLVGSAFSHYSFLHFGMNMYVLWTLAPFAHVMGQRQFTAFYVSSGVFANAISVIYRQLPIHKAVVASLGASGCLYAVVGALCIKFPNVQFGVPLLSDVFPTIHFKAEALWPALLTFDVTGLLLGFRLFDHVAHMSGLLFGLWYAKFGDKHLWSKNFRLSVINIWRRIRPID